MKTMGYIVGKGSKIGDWILDEESIRFYYQSKIGALFAGLGFLGGVLSSATSKDKALVNIPLSSIVSAEFVKFRLNNKSILMKTTDDEIQFIVDEPDEWLSALQVIAKKNKES